MRKKVSLKGLHGIYVVIEDLGPEMKGLVTRKELQTRVESRLCMAGIKPLKEKEAAKMACEPYLYVNIAAVPIGSKRYACRMDIEVHQLVTLLQDSSQCHAVTWDDGVITVGGANTILDQLDELIFEFIYDYLAVNPKA